jgi:thioredoxin family protein
MRSHSVSLRCKCLQFPKQLDRRVSASNLCRSGVRLVPRCLCRRATGWHCVRTDPRQEALKDEPKLRAASVVSIGYLRSAIAISLVKREFFPRSTVNTLANEPPQFVPSWEQAIPVAFGPHRLNAPVVIVEFVDLECPICARFDSTIRTVLAHRAESVALLYVHFPLPQHRFAWPAARVVECANALGSGDELMRVIYNKQDSLGLKSWASYGSEAGITDTTQLQRCATEGPSPRRIDDGALMGRTLDVRGTPTLLVNGWMLRGGGWTAERLVALVDALSSGTLGAKSSPRAVANIVMPPER